MMSSLNHASLALTLLVAGCGAAAGLSPTFPDNRGEDLSAALARVDAGAHVDEPIAVGLTEDRLYAYDLTARRMRWEQPVGEARTAPLLAGELVVLHEGSRVVGRRLRDGAVAFAVSDEQFQLIGAAGEGPLGVAVLSTGGSVGARSRVLVWSGGSVRAELAIDAAAGGPAVRGGLVFLPWGNQNLSVLDGSSSREVARLRFLDGVVGHARASAAGVFFGQTGFGRVSPSADRSGTGWYQPQTAALPGQPPLWRDAYAPPAGPRSATHRIRLEWAPAAGTQGPSRTTDDTLYLTFYRLVFALAQEGLAPRWVHEHPADVVGAAARTGGVLLADAEGGLTFVDTEGRPRWSAETNVRPTVVALRLDGFEPAGDPGPRLPSLSDQLLAAVQSTDARLLPARAYAVGLLAGQDDAGVTERLIVLCDDAQVPADLRRSACQSLEGRALGSDAVLAALQRRANYLSGTRPPPVGALAAVAARQGERRAVPLLLGHLRDPATAPGDLAGIASALGRLGDASAVQPLTDFVWLYHAESDDEALAAALGAAARAMVELAGPRGREEVQRVLDAPFTTPRARAQLQAAVPTGATQQ